MATPHPFQVAVTVDLAIFTVRDERLRALLVTRGTPPFLAALSRCRDGPRLYSRGPATLLHPAILRTS
jgi:hypothetical protein